MKIILTDHAKDRMVVRKITEKMVKEAITEPDSEGLVIKIDYWFLNHSTKE